jgi:hypothetical protein
MRIYVDNVSKYVVSAASINTYVSMASGTHNLVVQAWDATGAVLKKSQAVTVR